LAFIPDANGKPSYPTTAQVASRQGPHLARNIIRRLDGEPTEPFSFTNLGAFAAIGRRKAAALVKGVRIRGFLGWVLYRGAYFVKFPGFATRVRLLADWTLELILKSPPVQIGVHRHRRL
jgi:NADH dehydrogenase